MPSDITCMWNLKKKGTHELFYKTKIESQVQKTSMISSGVREGGKNWETEIDIYILLYIKQITNKDLLEELYLRLCNGIYITGLAPWKKTYDKPRQCIKKQRHHFADKGPYSQSSGFSMDGWMDGMYGCESWTINKASEVKVTQSSPTVCEPMDYTVYGILQARVLEWVVFPFSMESSQQGLNPGLPHCRQILYQLG